MRSLLLALCSLALSAMAVEESQQGVLALLGADGPAARLGGSGDRLDQPPLIAGSAVLIAREADHGLALSLAEALPPDDSALRVVLPGGAIRKASLLRRDPRSSALLLRVALLPQDEPRPFVLAASDGVALGDTVWTVGNAFDAVLEDGLAALSRGSVAGRYEIPADAPPVRGRRGAVLSDYRGPVIEVDAAVNDGNQGGALCDAAGRLIGLVSLGVGRERRLGTAVPIDLILAGLELAPAEVAPTRLASDGQWREQGLALAEGLALVYFIRDGNEDLLRPPPLTPDLPRYERRRLAEQWDRYHHASQLLRPDQPVTALVVDAEEGLLLTAHSHLDEGVDSALLLDHGRSASHLSCQVVAVHLPLDLVLLRAEGPLQRRSLRFDKARPSRGSEVALIGHQRQSPTMTRGIVSADRRRLGQSPHALLQIDALANYGNLGGALMDSQGRLVGMAVMIGARADWPWGLNSGVAMAVDVPTLAEALEGLRRGESVYRPPTLGLGVQLQPGPGLVVARVIPESGAAAGGVQPGDRLLRLDGQAIAGASDLSRLLIGREVGAVVSLSLARGDKVLDLSITLSVF